MIAGIVLAAVALSLAWAARRAPTPGEIAAAPVASGRPVAAPATPPAATAAPATEQPKPSATAATVARAAASSFPQLHVNPRRTRKEPEKQKKRLPPHTLYETEAGSLVDTADPAEVPFEGDFPKRGTFSFWLNPVWEGTNQDDASFVTVADGRLRIVKNVSFLRYEAVDPSGADDGIGFRLADWQPGEWHFITATWDDSVIALYVDGVLVGQKNIPSLDLPADASVTLGSMFPPGRPIAPGMMSGFRFRSRPLPSGAIGHEFETTLPAPIGEDGQ